MALKRSHSFDSDLELASDDFEQALLAADLDVALVPNRSTKQASAAKVDDAYQVTGFGEGGLYQRNKRLKLLIQNDARRLEDLDEDEERPPQWAQPLHVYINGFTEGLGLKQMTELLLRHGGIYVPYLDKKSLVTHIIASNLTPSKQKEFARYKVATPAWLTDSAAAGRLLDWRGYALLAAPIASKTPHGLVDEHRSRATQQSLFGMGLGGGRHGTASVLTAIATSKPGVAHRPSPRNDPPKPAVAVPASKPQPKDVTETMESLADRGLRLGQLANAVNSPGPVASTSSHDFFAPRSPARPTSPSKAAKGKGVATTDSVDAMTETYASYLPTKQRSERTTALLKDPDWLAKNTSACEGFVANYFEQSRLHHISTWKEELKTHVAALQPADSRPPRKQKLTGTPSDKRTVFHIDFDCFFVAAGLTTRPELKGKPVAVCHGGQGEGVASTSEIATCSYEARDKGVKSGISLGRAREMCPDIITIPFEFDLYRNIASKFYQIVLSHADFLQAVSIDEVLMEVAVLPTSASGSVDPAIDLAEQIRDEIRAATGCEVSVGVSHNILLARMASREAKPAGSYHLRPNQVDAYLSELPVGRLPGIGWSTEEKLEEKLGVTTIGGLLKVPRAQLQDAIGKQNGEKFEAFARGIDARELEGAKPRGSVSAEVNYGIRFTADAEVERFVRELGHEVARRVKKEGLRARHLTLKVMKRHPSAPVEAPKFLGHGHCDTHNASTPISAPGPGNRSTDDGDVIGAAAWKQLQALRFPPHELRGIAIALSKLEGGQIAVAREKGQGTLSFGAAARPESPTTLPPAQKAVPKAAPLFRQPPPTSSTGADDAPTSTPASSLLPPPPKQATRTATKNLEKKVSVIVLDDSDSDEASIPRPPAPPKTRKAPSPAKKNQPALAPLFQSTKRDIQKKTKRVTDPELKTLGIDVQFYRAIPPKDQADIVAQARTQLLKKPSAKVAFSEKSSSEPDAPVASPSRAPAAARSPSRAPPEAFVVSSSPTDSQLVDLGIDPIVFRDLPDEYRREQFIGYKSRQVKGDSRPSRNHRPAANTLDVQIPPAPSFNKKKKATLEDVCEYLERWVDEADEPVDEDVAVLEGFVEKCLDRTTGQDMAMAVGIVRWLALLVEDRHGLEGERGGPATEWWRAVRRLRARVEVLVEKDCGRLVRF